MAGCPTHDPDVAVRIIYWLPRQRPSRARAGWSDQKSSGDVFYASAAARGEAIADAWLRQKGSSHN